MNSTFFFVVLISSISYICGGLLIFIKKNWTQTSLLALSATSAGLLLSIAILDLIPDTEHNLPSNNLYVMLGLIIMYIILQSTHVWKKKREIVEFERGSILGISIGMGLHNFFEGLSIGISYAENVSLGISVSLALVLHKIPEGISYSSSVFSILQHRRKTAIYLITQGLFTWIGVCISVLLSYLTEINEKFIAVPLAMTAGIFIYIGGTCLLPITNKMKDIKILVSFLGGVIIYFILHSISEWLSLR